MITRDPNRDYCWFPSHWDTDCKLNPGHSHEHVDQHNVFWTTCEYVDEWSRYRKFGDPMDTVRSFGLEG